MGKTAKCALKPFNGSGISGTLILRQSDDGGTLSISGNAKGFQNGRVYVSLVYGLGSNADVDVPLTPPGPCVDDRSFNIVPAPVISDRPGDITFDPVATKRMLIGVWKGALGQFLLGGERSLGEENPTSAPVGVRLEEIATISIREVAIPNLTSLNFLRDARPQLFQLRACGQIVPKP